MTVVLAVVAVFGAVITGVSIRGLVRLVSREPAARGRLVADQVVTFEEPGPMVLVLQGPRLTTRFAGLSYELLDATSGASVPFHRVLVRTTTSGPSGATLSVARLDLPAAGTYRLVVAGLDADVDTSDCAFQFRRPHGPALALWIVGIVLGASALIGGLVGATLFGASVAHAAEPADCSNAGTQVEINLCTAARSADADAELNRVYREVRGALPADHRSRLESAQRAWIAYRDAACTAEAFPYQDGSAHPSVISTCQERLTRERIDGIRRVRKEATD